MSKDENGGLQASPQAPALGSDTTAPTGDPLLSLKLLEIFVT